jgi:hypothetical protein
MSLQFFKRLNQYCTCTTRKNVNIFGARDSLFKELLLSIVISYLALYINSNEVIKLKGCQTDKARSYKLHLFHMHMAMIFWQVLLHNSLQNGIMSCQTSENEKLTYRRNLARRVFRYIDQASPTTSSTQVLDTF